MSAPSAAAEEGFAELPSTRAAAGPEGDQSWLLQALPGAARGGGS
jgi:hypothetical protein